MQTVHSPRTRCGTAACRGFTLIELMITLTILTVVAAAIFAGMRQDEFQGQFSRYVDDVRGGMVQGRNWAIDNQTRVRLTVSQIGVDVEAFDPVNITWNRIYRREIAAASDSNLTSGNACILGVTPGVQTPKQATSGAAYDPPSACLVGTQEFEFQPDGSFLATSNITAIDNTGLTMWVADHSAGTAQLTMIQLFPGGLVRKFEGLRS